MFRPNLLRLLLLVMLSCPVSPSTTALASQEKNPPSKPGTFSYSMQLLTDPQGIDFTPTLRGVYLAIKDKWVANIPPPVLLGEQGVNAVEFEILKDGTGRKDSLIMITPSHKTDLDNTTLRAIHEASASPFPRLPEKFSAPSIRLRLTFYYNVKPPKT